MVDNNIVQNTIAVIYPQASAIIKGEVSRIPFLSPETNKSEFVGPGTSRIRLIPIAIVIIELNKIIFGPVITLILIFHMTQSSSTNDKIHRYFHS